MPGDGILQPKLFQYLLFFVVFATHESHLVFSLKTIVYLFSAYPFTILSPFYLQKYS